MSEGSINRSLSRAWTAPVRAMNRFLGTADGRTADTAAQATTAARWSTAALYVDGKREPGDFTPDEALREACARDNAFVWLGLHEPTLDEMSGIAQTYGLHELAVEDAVKAEQRPKLEQFGDVHFLVLRTARYVPHGELTETSQVVETGQMMIFIGERFVITVRHGDASELAPVRAEPGDRTRRRCSSRARGRSRTRSPTGWSTSTSRSPTRSRPTSTSSRRACSPATAAAGSSRSTR